jgi:hypothetical protein
MNSEVSFKMKLVPANHFALFVVGTFSMSEQI